MARQSLIHELSALRDAALHLFKVAPPPTEKAETAAWRALAVALKLPAGTLPGKGQA